MTASPAAGIARSLAALTAARLLGLGASFLAGVVAARLLGPVGLGAFGIAQTIALFVAITANAGLSMASIYRLRRSDDVTSDSRALLGLTSILAVVAGIATALGLSIGGRLVGVEPTTGLVSTAVVLSAWTLIADVTASMLLGLGANRQYTISEAIRYLSILPLVVALCLAFPTPAGYVAAAGTAVVVTAAYTLVSIRRRTGRLRPRIDRSVWTSAARYGLRGQPGNILQYFSLRIDIVLVGALAGLGPAGVYLVATRVAEVPTQVANAATSFLFPAVATRGAPRTVTGAVVRPVIVMVTATAILIGFGGLPLLRLVFGTPYDTGYPALLVLLVGAVPLSYTRLIGADLKGRGRPGLVSLVSLLGLPITIVGDILTVPVYGILAAAVVSTVAYAVTAAALAVAYRFVAGEAVRSLIPRASDVTLILERTRAAILRRPAMRREEA